MLAVQEVNKAKAEIEKIKGQTLTTFDGSDTENADSVQVLIHALLETLNPSQDVEVVQKSLKILENDKISVARNRILADVQTELHQVSLQVEEKKKIVSEKESKLNQLKEEESILLSNIRQLEHNLSDEIAENDRLVKQLKSVEEDLNQELTLSLSVLTLSVFNHLGIEFMNWNAEKKEYQKFITKSVSENRVTSVPIDMTNPKYSRSYYPDLLWSLVSQ